MNSGKPFEWVYIDLVYDDETFGVSQPMTRYEADYNLRRLSHGWEINGKRVVQAEIKYIDPQPTAVLSDLRFAH